MLIQIPQATLKELQKLEDSEWSVSAQELVDWVNHTAERFLPPDSDDKSGRVSQNLSLRAMRYYQTLGCIDAPVRVGREVRYGYRHYLQALLVRKMLWQRVPAAKMASLLPGRTTTDYKNLLLEDIQLVVQPASTKSPSPSQEEPETWKRIFVSEGVELHLRVEGAPIDANSIPALLEKLEAALRRHSAAKHLHKTSSRKP